jgi:hypothetical protein
MATKAEQLKKRYAETLNHEYRDQHEKIAQMCNRTALEVMDALMEEIEGIKARLDGY